MATIKTDGIHSDEQAPERSMKEGIGVRRSDRGRGQVTGFQLQPVPQDDGLVEGQPTLRTVPRNKIVDCKPIGTRRVG